MVNLYTSDGSEIMMVLLIFSLRLIKSGILVGWYDLTVGVALSSNSEKQLLPFFVKTLFVCFFKNGEFSGQTKIL